MMQKNVGEKAPKGKSKQVECSKEIKERKPLRGPKLVNRYGFRQKSGPETAPPNRRFEKRRKEGRGQTQAEQNTVSTPTEKKSWPENQERKRASGS